MSDLRSLDLMETDKSLNTNTLMRQPVTLTAGSANNAEYFGFFCNTSGGAWSFKPIDGKTPISFTPVAQTYYPYHISSITPFAGDVGHGNLGGFARFLIDPISEWTMTGTETLTNDILTVAVGDSSDLDDDLHSIYPVVGAKYNYEYTITNYTSATKAEFKYGGVVFYTKAATGSYTGSIIATAATALEVDIDVVATDDFVMTGLQITRA